METTRQLKTAFEALVDNRKKYTYAQFNRKRHSLLRRIDNARRMNQGPFITNADLVAVMDAALERNARTRT